MAAHFTPDTDPDTTSPSAPVTVLYIAGAGRSGSTVLDRVLGASEGVASLNEIYRLLIDLYEDPGLCSCGEPPETCPFWSRVLARIDGSPANNPGVGQRMLALQKRYNHTRYFDKVLSGAFDDDPEFQDYLDWLGTLYRVIAEEAGVPVIIDSSKVPTMALILSKIPGLDVRVVHLVRHPAAVAKAWASQKYDPSKQADMPRQPIWKTALRWRLRTRSCDRLAAHLPVHALRYEDFTADPAAETARLVQAIAADVHPGVTFRDRAANLKAGHTLAGNPDRHASGWTDIRPAAPLKAPLHLRVMTWALTWPLAGRLGYRIGGRS
ncbi:MAG: sulfotransferase [Pseudomonadota bacterium]